MNTPYKFTSEDNKLHTHCRIQGNEFAITRANFTQEDAEVGGVKDLFDLHLGGLDEAVGQLVLYNFGTEHSGIATVILYHGITFNFLRDQVTFFTNHPFDWTQLSHPDLRHALKDTDIPEGGKWDLYTEHFLDFKSNDTQVEKWGISSEEGVTYWYDNEAEYLNDCKVLNLDPIAS